MKVTLLMSCVILLSGAGPAVAQTYPVKPVRMVVPYAPGGGVDIMARILAPKLSAALGQQFVIDNRGGAGAVIGTDLVGKAAPDGYTLLFTNPAHVSNPALNAKLPFDAVRDFTAVGLAGLSSSVLVVHPQTPAKTVKELVALALAKPGQLNYASAGVGSAIFLAMELFKSTAKIEVVHIPYKGAGPAMTDVIGGQVPLMFIAISPSLPHIKAGRLRALGTSSAKGLPVLPEVRPIADTFAGFDHTDWYGVLAPAGTPAAIVSRLNREINHAFTAPDVRERVLGLGAEPQGGSVQEFDARIKTEIRKWAGVFGKGAKP
jgi:tripartite-type tricarboxylate transporter receptor subunit TctC